MYYKNAVQLIELILLSPVIFSILCKNYDCFKVDSSQKRAINWKFPHPLPLPPLRISSINVSHSFDTNEGRNLRIKKHLISLRKSNDIHKQSEKWREHDISSRILDAYGGNKSAKVIHTTRTVALQQPNVFVYLPSPISPIKDEKVKKQMVGIDSTNIETIKDFSGKSVPFNEEKVVTKALPLNIIYERDQLNDRRILSQPLAAGGFIESQRLPSRVIESKPFVRVNHLIVRPLPPPPPQFLRTVPLMKQKAIIITPAIPRKTTTVYTTQYTPATKTVVYEAEHIPLRTDIQIFGTHSQSFGGYHSVGFPFANRPNYIKSTFIEKLINSPVFSYKRRIDDILGEEENYRQTINPTQSLEHIIS